MYLIAGLGNPGLKYRKTPHNAGFLAADALAKNLGARFVKKGNGKVAEARIGAQKVLIVKPQTFMNLSGECIAPLAQYYRIPAEHIVICYDDKDLEPGKLRIRKEGSAGSHNGMKSVILSLGTQAFTRIRMGIGAPRGMRLMDHVLHKLTKEEQALYLKMAEDAAAAAVLLVSQGIEAAQQKFSSKAPKGGNAFA